MSPSKCNCSHCTTTNTESSCSTTENKTQCTAFWDKDEKEFVEKKIHPKHQHDNKYRR